MRRRVQTPIVGLFLILACAADGGRAVAGGKKGAKDKNAIERRPFQIVKPSVELKAAEGYDPLCQRS